MDDAVDRRFVPALGEDLAVREDADFAIVKLLQQLLSLILRERAVYDSACISWALNVSAIFVACSTSTQKATDLAIVRVIHVGCPRYSAVSKPKYGIKSTLNRCDHWSC